MDTMIMMSCIMTIMHKLLQTTGYVRKVEGNTTMSFKIKHKQLLKKYNQMRKKITTFFERRVSIIL